MFGVLTIAVRIYHDRWGYGVYSGPIGSAILIIAAKWVRTCEPQRSGRLPWRRLFPLGVSTHLPSHGRQAGHGASANTQEVTVGRPRLVDPVCIMSGLTSSGSDPSYLISLPHFPYL